MQVTVEQRHIDDGCRRLSDLCGIAIAVGEKLGTNQVCVDTTRGIITVNSYIGPSVYKMTKRAVEWAKAFDYNKKSVKPTSFRFKAVE